jgi:lipopolysaccharide transport system permease protein
LHHGHDPFDLVRSAWSHRALIRRLARHDIAARYRGSVLGGMWALFHPLLMLVVYAFVFGKVFGAKWRVGDATQSDFTVALFAGLLAYNLFAECVNRAPSLILSNPSFVTKVVFPLELLPLVVLAGALFNFVIGFFVWLAFHALVIGSPPLTVLLLPLALLPLLALAAGLTWLLASLGVFLRDAAQVVGILTTALLFLSPVFFPVSALPEPYRSLILWNPLAVPIEWVRALMMWGQVPDVGLFLARLGLTLMFAWLCFAWFQFTRKGFADVV